MHNCHKTLQTPMFPDVASFSQWCVSTSLNTQQSEEQKRTEPRSVFPNDSETRPVNRKMELSTVPPVPRPPWKQIGTGLDSESIYHRLRTQELAVSRRRITADNEFSMFSPEQILHESKPSPLITAAWASIVIVTSLFWCGIFAIVTWMSH